MIIFDKLFGKNKENEILKEHPIQDTQELIEEEVFWSIITKSKTNSKGDYEKQQDELNKELLKLSGIDILKFDNRFRTYRGEAYKWELWAAAYIMNGGCSDDSFSDFRGWLIGQGKTTFFEALKNPESLVNSNHEMDVDDWEGLSYIPMISFQQKTGNDIPQGIKENIDISGEEWSEESNDLELKFPKLWSKWGFE